MESDRRKIGKLETVKRRRDWVTIAGMVFFALILIAELCVAVGVPLMVRREGVLGAEVVRLNSITLFDLARFTTTKALEDGKNDQARNELNLLYVTMNVFANYMHENADDMTTEQFLMVKERSEKLIVFGTRLSGGKAYAVRNEVDAAGALARLAAAGEVPEVAGE